MPGLQTPAALDGGTKNSVYRRNIPVDIHLGITDFVGPQASPFYPVSFFDGAGNFDVSVKFHMPGFQGNIALNVKGRHYRNFAAVR